MDLVIVGGVQKGDAHQKEGVHRYAHARVTKLAVEGGDESVVFDYESPPAHCPDEDPSIVFTAAHVDDARIVVPTKTEVVVWDRKRQAVDQVISAPAFNDVHHAWPRAAGGYWVVNTGLDQLLAVDESATILEAHDVLGGEAWAHFDPAVDYRKVTSTKPHRAHPNYAFEFEGRLWVTRFKQRDCVAVDDVDARMPIDLQGCHDGFVLGDHVYFTTVDGHVVKTRPGLDRPAEVWNLATMVPGLRKLGWCRGLHMLSPTHAIVGFSRLRITKWRENVAWAGGLAAVKALGHRPTRVTAFDLAAGRVLWNRDLETVDAVFSLHVDDERVAGS